MDGWTSCPGCGLQLPTGAVEGDHRVNASAECVQVYAEIVGFACQHLALLRLHQLTVDTYGAQHGGGTAPPIRLAYSLVGLHLALDCGLTGDEVRAAHQRMGKPNPSWPDFPPPPHAGAVTVMEVAREGLMVNAEAGHQAGVRRWADAVWIAWRPEHDRVVRLTRRLLPDLASSR